MGGGGMEGGHEGEGMKGEGMEEKGTRMWRQAGRENSFVTLVVQHFLPPIVSSDMALLENTV